MAVCAILSFRLGRADGVSIVAATWSRALRDLGFHIRTVAGDGPVDVTVPGLAIDGATVPGVDELEAALTGVDLTVVENLLSIPLNLDASRAVTEVLKGRPAILHHHDPSWQRERFAHVTELPPRDGAWRHVTINDLTRRQMAQRGIEATTIYNAFDVHEPIGDRAATRAAFGIEPDERLIIHPVRAIARKNIPKAIEMAEALGATYWLLGPAEENYDAELERLLARARTRVSSTAARPIVPGFYAASDIVAFPSHMGGVRQPADRGGHLPPARGRRLVSCRRRTAVTRLPVVRSRRHRRRSRSGSPTPTSRCSTTTNSSRGGTSRTNRCAQRLGALLAEAGWRP